MHGVDVAGFPDIALSKSLDPVEEIPVLGNDFGFVGSFAYQIPVFVAERRRLHDLIPYPDGDFLKRHDLKPARVVGAF